MVHLLGDNSQPDGDIGSPPPSVSQYIHAGSGWGGYYCIRANVTVDSGDTSTSDPVLVSSPWGGSVA